MKLLKALSQKGKILLIMFRTKANRCSVNALIAALDKEKLPVDILLLDHEEFGKLLNIENISGLLNKYERIILAFGFMTTMLNSILSLTSSIREIKTRYKKRVVAICGGPHPSGDPLGSILLGFDYAFIGEAECSFPHFIRKVIEGEDYSKTLGVAYVDDEYLIINNPPKPIDLNEYPPYPIHRRMFNYIEITRGCPHACYFCQTPRIFGTRPRHRSIESVRHYCLIKVKHGKTDLRFISPNALCYGSKSGFTVNIEVLENLLAELHSLRKINPKVRVFLGSFPSEIRPEFISEDTIKLLKKYTNNKRIIIGAQSGSEKVLKEIHRGHTLEDVLNATEIAVKHGFRVDVDFIFGLPCEEREDVEETMVFMRKLLRLGNVRVHAHVFMPLPGTPYANKEPKPIPSRLRNELFKLIGYGKLYGQWVKQEELAKMIVKLRKKGVIITGYPVRPGKVNFKNYLKSNMA